MKARVVCGWCKRDLGSTDVEVPEGWDPAVEPISHGICPECFKKLTGKAPPEQPSGGDQASPDEEE